MRTTIKKTGVLGATYAVALVCGLCTAKVLASRIGPLGYGYFSLYGAILTTGWMLTALGIPAGIPRFGASIIGTPKWANLKTAGVAITIATSLLAAVILVTWRQSIGIFVLHQSLGLAPTLMLIVAFVFGAQAPVQNAILKTERALRPLIIADSLAAVGGSMATIAMVCIFGDAGIVPSLALSAVLKWAIFARWTGIFPQRGTRDGAISAAKKLVGFGTTYSLSVTLTNLLSLTLPIIILHVSNVARVGLYAAATSVVAMYVGLFSSVLGRDFYPRIAALDPTHPPFRVIVGEEYELMLLLSLPASVLLIAVAPLVIPLVYSRNFLPMDGLIMWLAVAAILRLSGAVYGYVVLAKLSSRDYLSLEGVSGLVAFGLSVVGLLRWGLVGVGVAAVFSSGVHLMYGVYLVRKKVGFSMNLREKLGLMIAAAGAGVMLLVHQVPTLAVRDALSLAMVAGCTLVCSYILWNRWAGGATDVLSSAATVDE